MSLHDVFSAFGQLESFDAPVLETISLTRLLLCIATAALRPKTEQDWKECRNRIVTESLAYLDKYQSKFDLRGAFLQTPWVPKIGNRTLSSLMVACPSANSHLLFNHRTSIKWTEAQVALGLLTTQVFNSGGLLKSPVYTALGEEVHDEKIKDFSCGSPGSSTCVNILVTLIQGDTLLDTVHFNMIPENWVRQVPTMTLGKPVWEYGPFKTKGAEAQELSKSYLGNLVPLTRGIVIHEDDTVTMVGGAPVADYPEYREPMAAQYTIEKKQKKTSEFVDLYKRCSVSRAAWRDLEAILDLRQGPKGGIQLGAKGGVWALKHFIDSLSDHPKFTLLVGGFSCDKAKKEATPLWVYTLSAGMLNNDLLNLYAKFVGATEKGARILYGAAAACLCKERGETGKRKVDKTLDMIRSRSAEIYWPQMEALAMRVAQDLNDQRYQSEVRNLVKSAFIQAVPQLRPDSVAAGLLYIASASEQVEPQISMC